MSLCLTASLHPLSGTHSLLAFVLVHQHTHSLVFLKPTVSSRPSFAPAAHTKVPQICPLADMAHYKEFSLFIFLHMHLLTCLLQLDTVSLLTYLEWVIVILTICLSPRQVRMATMCWHHAVILLDLYLWHFVHFLCNLLTCYVHLVQAVVVLKKLTSTNTNMQYHGLLKIVTGSS